MVRKALGRGLEALIPNARELLEAPSEQPGAEDHREKSPTPGAAPGIAVQPAPEPAREPAERPVPDRAGEAQRPPMEAGPAPLRTPAVPGDGSAANTGVDAPQASPPPAPTAKTAPVPGSYAFGPAPDSKRALASGRASVVIDIALDRIKPNPFQPRERFDDAETDELAASIRSKGLLQPVLLRRQGVGYELIAGERRLRAARRAGLTSVPAIVRDASDREVVELALIENEQRVDLTPIESARSYVRILEEFQLSQVELADVLGRDRSTVSNLIRLLKLPEKVQTLIQEKRLSMGHARALLGVEDSKRCIALAERTVKQGLPVRSVERLVQSTPRRRGVARAKEQDAELYPFEERLRRRFATQVHIHRRNGRGRIEIEFYNADDLERILEELGALRDG